MKNIIVLILLTTLLLITACSNINNPTPSIYKLLDINGNIIIQGRGIIAYHDNLELYSIQSANSFSWLDKDANPIIIIPFLSSTFD